MRVRMRMSMKMRMRMRMSMTISSVYGGGSRIKTTNRDDSRFYDQRITGFSNYGVKILLDLVKILQIAFF